MRTWSRKSGKGGYFYLPPPRARKSQREQPGSIRLTLRGAEGSIAWGYYKAAELTSWVVSKNAKGEWALVATASRCEPFYLRQTQPSLLFTAPRAQASHWCWPVRELTYQGTTIRATLGNVEF